MRFPALLEIGVVSAVLSSALAQHNSKLTDSSSLTNPFDQTALNGTLQRLLLESRNRFERLQGARIENRLRQYYYEPKISLPGASYCRILLHEGITIYTCEWERQTTTAGGYSRFVASIERVLGPDWGKRSESRSSGQEVMFSADGKPTVQVIWIAKAAIVHVIVLPPDAPKQGIVSELPVLSDFFHP